jgi:methionyl-tRNA formyltransferase
MKIFYLGGHQLGVIGLKSLSDSPHEIVGVYTTKTDDDWYSGVDEFAESNNLYHVTGLGVNDDEIISIISDLNPDIIVSVNFNQIIGEQLIAVPKLGCINVHASLLPKYRGRAPLNWAILNGEEQVGVTVHYIDKGIDTGDIILQNSIKISQEYIGEILSKVKEEYSTIIVDALDLIAKKDFKPIRQGVPQIKYWEKRSPKDSLLDCSYDVNFSYNLVRASSKPYPGAYIIYENKKITLWDVDLIEIIDTNENGYVNLIDDKYCIKFEGGYLGLNDYESEITLEHGMVLR